MESSTIDVDQPGSPLCDETPSSKVVTVVARADGVDETELPPLYHTIDPDALDALFRSDSRTVVETRTSGTVTFGYCGYEVRVTADGTVDVEERATP